MSGDGTAIRIQDTRTANRGEAGVVQGGGRTPSPALSRRPPRTLPKMDESVGRASFNFISITICLRSESFIY